jgi:dienelactone hydrolase
MLLPGAVEEGKRQGDAAVFRTSGDGAVEQPTTVTVGPEVLEGTLGVPPGARGVVVFAHGSGSSRHSPRNRHVASVLREHGIATLLADLLTAHEEAVDAQTGHLRFDIAFLADRLAAVTDWLMQRPEVRNLTLGYFGASTGAAAALVVAGNRPESVRAIVSRGGRPDLAGPALSRVRAPTLLIVGGNDVPVIRLNQEAMQHLQCEQELAIVPGATHLFEEPGTLEEVARLAAGWFARHLDSR